MVLERLGLRVMTEVSLVIIITIGFCFHFLGFFGVGSFDVCFNFSGVYVIKMI